MLPNRFVQRDAGLGEDRRRPHLDKPGIVPTSLCSVGRSPATPGDLATHRVLEMADGPRRASR
jgi:hypothetical protein